DALGGGVAAAPEDGPPALAEGAAPDADALGGGVAAAPEDDPPALAEGAAPVELESPSPVIYSEDYEFALVPAEKRAPEGKGVDIPLDKQIAPITTRQEQKQFLDPVSFIASIEDALASAPPPPQGGASGAPTNFSVPVIAGMEKGMYYVQLRSYSRPELVESELVKIGKQHNVAVQVTELSGKQLYRILIGPVSFSESAKLLQQYKAKGWSDAFVWIGK
ncbi:MAG: SPOR domain-containing protein, partial [Treponema sp.]|nr:SPOR domain-containing protein [Treponema sp.]